MSVWLIGAGYMAQEYAQVLNELGTEYEVIGRGKKSAVDFESATKHKVKTGGLSIALKESKPPEKAIVAVAVEDLHEVSIQLVKSGVKRILLEKPGGLNKKEIKNLNKVAKSYNSEIMVAYNRRFYKSTEILKELIIKDGGATSCSFEFTEWSHIIGPLMKDRRVKETWFLANSTHVVDLAFHICGFPKEFQSWHQGSLSWHPSSARFCGSGVTDKNVLFSYLADWEAPGRWGVEVFTKKNRYILKPLEELQVIKLGSVKIESIEIDDHIDKQFKPGIYKQIKAFIDGDDSNFCSIESQLKHMDIYNKMAGYEFN
jgi:predicted dehydrogenase